MIDPGNLDRIDMQKHVRPAIVVFDEAETAVGIPLFQSARCHRFSRYFTFSPSFRRAITSVIKSPTVFSVLAKCKTDKSERHQEHASHHHPVREQKVLYKFLHFFAFSPSSPASFFAFAALSLAFAW
jgi:hypothetical protein